MMMEERIFTHNKLVIASHNKGKIVEIKDLLSPLNIEILSAYDFDIEEPEESGQTFEGSKVFLVFQVKSFHIVFP